MLLAKSTARSRYLIVVLVVVALAVVMAFVTFVPSGTKMPFGGAPTVDADQSIDSTRLGKIPPDDRARIAKEQPNAGSNDVECVGECGP